MSEPPVVHQTVNASGEGPTGVTATGNVNIYKQYDIGLGPVNLAEIVPPRHDQQIHGRDDVIDRLVAAAKSPDGRPRVLHGMGGGGKSTIAMAVAERVRAETDFKVYWVWGTDIHQSMLSVAADRGVAEAKIMRARRNWELAHQLVWDSLNGDGPRWLLVMDNVDDPSVLAAPNGQPSDGTGWLRSSERGLLLITSRYSDRQLWGKDVELCKVAPLAPPTGAKVLLDLASGCGDEQEAAQLSERLGGVPLALRLAGQYLAKEWTSYSTFAQYRAALDDVLVELIDMGGNAFSQPDNDDMTARRSVRATWELSLRMLEKKEFFLARPLLRLLSCFGAPHSLRRELLPTGPLTGSFLDPDGRLTELEIDKTVETLAAVSLLERLTVPVQAGTAEGVPPIRAMSLHPLVCEVIAATVDSAVDQARLWQTARLCLTHATPGDPTDPRRWPAWTTLPAVHTSVLRRIPQEHNLSGILDMASVCAKHLTTTGLLKEAHELTQLAIERSDELPADDPARLGSRLAAIEVNRQEGNLQTTFDELTSLLADAEAQLAPGSPLLVTIRQNLASILTDRAQYDDADALYKKIMSDVADPPRSVRLGYGQLLTERADFIRAEALLRPLLAEEHAEHGPDHPATLAVREAIATLLAARGDLDIAQTEFEKLLQDQQRLFGQDTLPTLVSRMTLLSIHTLKGDPGAAQGQLQTVLKIQRNSLNPEHPLALLGLGALTSFQDEDESSRDGEETLRTVGQLLARSLAPRNPKVLFVRFVVALKQHAHEPFEAEAECQAVLNEHIDLFGADNPVTLTTRWLVSLMICQRDSAHGADALRDLREAQLRTLGRDHPQTTHTLVSLANVANLNGEPEKAEEYLRTAIESLIRVHGEDAEETQEVKGALVFLLVALERHTEALEQLTELLVSVQKTDGPNSDRAMGTRLLLAAFRYNAEQYAESEQECRELLPALTREFPDEIGYQALVQWLLGELLHRTGRIREAEVVLQDALSGFLSCEDPDDDDPELRFYLAQVRLELGEVLQERKNLAEAEVQLQLALSMLNGIEAVEDSLLQRANAALTVVSTDLKEIGPAASSPAPSPSSEEPAVVTEAPVVSTSELWRDALRSGNKDAVAKLIGPDSRRPHRPPARPEPAPVAPPVVIHVEPAQPVHYDLPDDTPPLPERELRNRLRGQDHPPTRYQLARTLAHNGFPLAAAAELAALDSVLRRADPNGILTMAVRIDIASSKLDRGETAAATRELRRLAADATARLGGSHQLTLRARIGLALAEGPPDQAIRHLQDILAVADTVAARVALAKLYQANGAYSQAADECQAALRMSSQATEALSIRALLASATADHEQLAAIVREQCRLQGASHPDVAATRHQLGLALLRVGRQDAGRQELQAALSARAVRLGRTHPATRATSEALAAIRPPTSTAHANP